MLKRDMVVLWVRAPGAEVPVLKSLYDGIVVNK